MLVAGILFLLIFFYMIPKSIAKVYQVPSFFLLSFFSVHEPLMRATLVVGSGTKMRNACLLKLSINVQILDAVVGYVQTYVSANRIEDIYILILQYGVVGRD